METPPVAPVGSIPTRSRHPRAIALVRGSRSHVRLRHLALGCCIAAGPLAGPELLRAQDSVGVVRTAVTPDSLGRRIGPMGAFWRSFLIPGWGQARLGRKLTGGIFVAWEGVTLGMSLKTRHELAYLRRNGSERADDKRKEHEDWIVLLAFNHVFAGLEAYVSAHLSDFPPDLRIQAVPGGIGGAVTIPFRLR
jgi:hypothetical protein